MLNSPSGINGIGQPNGASRIFEGVAGDCGNQNGDTDYLSGVRNALPNQGGIPARGAQGSLCQMRSCLAGAVGRGESRGPAASAATTGGGT